MHPYRVETNNRAVIILAKSPAHALLDQYALMQVECIAVVGPSSDYLVSDHRARESFVVRVTAVTV